MKGLKMSTATTEIDYKNPINDAAAVGIPVAIDGPDMKKIFGRDRELKLIEDIEPSENKEPQNKKTLSIQKKEESDDIETVDEKKEVSPATDSSEDEKEKKKYNDWKDKYEKSEKNLKETQKWANDLKRQVSSFKKNVEKYRDSDTSLLDEEEIQSLLALVEERETPSEMIPQSQKITKIWDSEIENIRKYGNYEHLDEHIEAINYLMANSSQDEIDDMFEDAKSIIDEDPVGFTKKVLEIGKDYYEDIYKDLKEAGNLKGLKDSFYKKEEDYKKTIDKLEKELIKLKKRYEDFDDKPNYRISHGGDDYSQNDGALLKNPGKLIKQFNQGKYRV